MLLEAMSINLAISKNQKSFFTENTTVYALEKKTLS